MLNKAISKTQKVNFFTPALLANVASLYKWNGLVDLITDDNVSSAFFFLGFAVDRFVTCALQPKGLNLIFCN